MEKTKINIRRISMRAKTKKEVFRLLQLEADIFLPPIAHTNRKYIAEILAGKKMVSGCTNLIYIVSEELST